jgi:hypothetical protein
MNTRAYNRNYKISEEELKRITKQLNKQERHLPVLKSIQQQLAEEGI